MIPTLRNRHTPTHMPGHPTATQTMSQYYSINPESGGCRLQSPYSFYKAAVWATTTTTCLWLLKVGDYSKACQDTNKLLQDNSSCSLLSFRKSQTKPSLQIWLFPWGDSLRLIWLLLFHTCACICRRSVWTTGNQRLNNKIITIFR